MVDNRVDTPSVVERTRPIAPAGSGIVDAHFLGRTSCILLVSPEGETRRSPPALDRQADRRRDPLSPATVSRVLRRLGLNNTGALEAAEPIRRCEARNGSLKANTHISRPGLSERTTC